MTIYKLGEIINIINGKDIKFYNETHKTLVVGSGGILGTTKDVLGIAKNAFTLPRVGTMKIIWYDNWFYNINTCFATKNINDEISHLKYVYFYLLNKNWKMNISSTTRPLITKTNWLSFKIKLPTIENQKKIIDIIEPIENLFIKYPNTINISSYELAKNDVKIIIDIIEPAEIMNNQIKIISKKIEFLLSGSINYNKKIKLKDCVSISNINEKGIEQYSNKAINPKTILNNDDEGFNKYKTKGKFGRKLQLIINTLGPSTKKFAILHKNVDVLGELVILDVKEEFQTLVLGNLLTETFWSNVNSRTKGTIMQRISIDELLNIDLFDTNLKIDNLFEIVASLNLLKNKLEKYIEKLVKILVKQN